MVLLKKIDYSRKNRSGDIELQERLYRNKDNNITGPHIFALYDPNIQISRDFSINAERHGKYLSFLTERRYNRYEEAYDIIGEWRLFDFSFREIRQGAGNSSRWLSPRIITYYLNGKRHEAWIFLDKDTKPEKIRQRRR